MTSIPFYITNYYNTYKRARYRTDCGTNQVPGTYGMYFDFEFRDEKSAPTRHTTDRQTEYFLHYLLGLMMTDD